MSGTTIPVLRSIVSSSSSSASISMGGGTSLGTCSYDTVNSFLIAFSRALEAKKDAKRLHLGGLSSTFLCFLV
jgi:hypothetical protein